MTPMQKRADDFGKVLKAELRNAQSCAAPTASGARNSYWVAQVAALTVAVTEFTKVEQALS